MVTMPVRPPTVLHAFAGADVGKRMSGLVARLRISDRPTLRRGARISFFMVLLAYFTLFAVFGRAEAPTGYMAAPPDSESSSSVALECKRRLTNMTLTTGECPRQGQDRTAPLVSPTDRRGAARQDVPDNTVL